MKKIRYKKNTNYLFVDGYNIINSWEVFKHHEESLEDQRNRLMDILSEYGSLIDEKIILVFDGYMVERSPGSIFEYNNILVVFTRQSETADHFIERELSEMGRVRRIRVATSDNIEQTLILASGGSRISAREFEIEIQNGAETLTKNRQELNQDSKNFTSLDEDTIEKLRELKDKMK